jgi:hypothetical protein
MIVQWPSGGNVQLSAASGRDAIKEICREADRPFVTTRPPASAQQRPSDTQMV